ncbi:hypothetical protein NIF40_01165 [[Clostridium] leptum]|nr:hypothetical protein [[Clostridium] leptum]
MKARIPARHKVSNKQYKALTEIAKKEVQKKEVEQVRRIFKLFAWALHNNESDPWGKVRIGRLIADVGRLCSEKDQDPVFWQHLDKCMQQIGLDFELENYDKMEEL